MPELFTISLLAAGKVAITRWLAKQGADFVKDKATSFAGDKAKEIGKSQLRQFGSPALIMKWEAKLGVEVKRYLIHWKHSILPGAIRNN